MERTSALGAAERERERERGRRDSIGRYLEHNNIVLQLCPRHILRGTWPRRILQVLSAFVLVMYAADATFSIYKPCNGHGLNCEDDEVKALLHNALVSGRRPSPHFYYYTITQFPLQRCSQL